MRRQSAFQHRPVAAPQAERNEVWDAVYAQDYARAQALLTQSVNIPSINRPHGIWGNTCAHVAVLHNNRKLVALLLLHKVNLNGININGTTPLHFAVEQRRTDMVKYLVENGASPSKRNYTFKSPLELAKTFSDNKAMVKLLQDAYNVERGAANLQP
ncbi:hypothetical protein SDRG_01503 [Saprolegnia diclina VS20]|uniref:Uncharacterized protein n=1 Tax=Saprolegnia diclina (strain VS20) TaxID=1156394 RepID=T0R5A4_SAPDV|nr:hypothetical protein SDRG_01503 [Saprolegnia diclina VS20]EQC41540.1 hypothetical protein SDRG_01503 [Saprolegnia diclina VS20]|eukprot:XP_008605254.1 hypothetical protein SDRG_01503 [Saprolegnia diclina VS20]